MGLSSSSLSGPEHHSSPLYGCFRSSTHRRLLRGATSLASESKDGVPDSRCSPESTDTLRSLFTLPLSELKGGTPAWVFFRFELLGEIWLALAPWFPAPTPFEPRLQVGPWFTFWCWDWAPPFPVLP